MFFYGQGVEENDSEAGKYYKKAIDLGYDDWDILGNYGMILYRDDNFEESAKYFAKSAKITNEPMTCYNAGLAYYAAEDYDNALTWFGKAIDNGYYNPDEARSMIRSMADEGLVSEKDAEKYLTTKNG